MKNALLMSMRTALVLFVTCTTAFSQDQTGLRTGNYAGVLGLSNNPTSTALSTMKWDINLFSASLFGRNNYGYFRNTSLLNLAKNPNLLASVLDTMQEKSIPSNAIIQDFYLHPHPLSGSLEINISGPGLSFRVGEHHQFGLFSNFRTQVGAYNISKQLQYKALVDLERFEQVSFKSPLGGAGMAWSELGMNYAWRSVGEGDLNYAFGISSKLLLGLEGGYVNSNQDFKFQKSQGDTISVFGGNWDYALTTQNVNAALRDKGMQTPNINGKGLGFDLGFSISMPDEDGDTDEDYLWKVGASILDLGAVKFDNHAQKHHIEFEGERMLSMKNFTHTDDLYATLQDASLALLDDPNASLVKNSFKIGLPTAFALQYDQKIIPFVYVSVNAIQRLGIAPNRLKRANLLAVAPRFELKRTSVTFPMHLV
jgi:hypothetical protein